MLALFAQTACTWEATARKAGNVHPGASFDNLTYQDFLNSAQAIAPVMALAPQRPLGETIRDAVRATRAVVATNTNLGIVLLLAPLAKTANLRTDLERILSGTTVEDTRRVYEAIRLAQPGGMGKVQEQDVAGEPTQTLREVMGLAADRDLIARQYANGFREVFEDGVPALLAGYEEFGTVEAAIIACQLHWLAHFPDSLIVRKRGLADAEEVMRRAQGVVTLGLQTAAGRMAYAELDGWLRGEGHSRNPGTTADLVTACLFVALREYRMEVSAPFPWLLLSPFRPSGHS